MVAYTTKVLTPFKRVLKRVPAGFPVYGVRYVFLLKMKDKVMI